MDLGASRWATPFGIACALGALGGCGSDQMGNAREYAVHVPTGYSKDTPVPALFCIHGFGQNPVMFCLDKGERRRGMGVPQRDLEIAKGAAKQLRP